LDQSGTPYYIDSEGNSYYSDGLGNAYYTGQDGEPYYVTPEGEKVFYMRQTEDFSSSDMIESNMPTEEELSIVEEAEMPAEEEIPVVDEAETPVEEDLPIVTEPELPEEEELPVVDELGLPIGEEIPVTDELDLPKEKEFSMTDEFGLSAEEEIQEERETFAIQPAEKNEDVLDAEERVSDIHSFLRLEDFTADRPLKSILVSSVPFIFGSAVHFQPSGFVPEPPALPDNVVVSLIKEKEDPYFKG
jgi:hypothetical protein